MESAMNVTGGGHGSKGDSRGSLAEAGRSGQILHASQLVSPPCERQHLEKIDRAA